MKKQDETLKNGSYYPSDGFVHALKRIWDPDTYDADGNKEELIFERPKK